MTTTSEKSGFELVPTGAKIFAACCFATIVVLFARLLGDHEIPWFGIGMGLVLGTFLAATILLAGYVYGDASRRGMPPVAWTALAVLVPNGIGFVLYFLLRKPLVHLCSACGRAVAVDAAFCPACGHEMGPHVGVPDTAKVS
jgi:hypothetical protein